MSSIGGAGIGASLYAVVSSPTQIAAQPEGTEEKAHHLKNGKGFTNPWDSYVAISLWDIFKVVFW
jgi:N-acyl-phosphatidylethanolamine-hydrolysing phospholipase D